VKPNAPTPKKLVVGFRYLNPTYNWENAIGISVNFTLILAETRSVHLRFEEKGED
jgi:hypothetical protein